MRVICLVSGGKDSILAAMLARRMGHELAAVANLYAAPSASPSNEASAPPSSVLDDKEADNEEIDSYMFQTVGHSVIASIATCLQLPLYRAAIRRGQSVVQALDYSSTPPPDDEVEVLLNLLREIKTADPTVGGVVSGAILSHYQRLRVEACCYKLGLVSIAPLWQMEAATVLELVGLAHVDARLIKVATMGLTPSKHLGQSLLSSSVRGELLRLEAKLGLHPAGEGGEFESLVVDCPLFASQRIVLEDVSVRLDDEQADVGALLVRRHMLIHKSDDERAADAVVWNSFTSSSWVDDHVMRMKWIPSISEEDWRGDGSSAATAATHHRLDLSVVAHRFPSSSSLRKHAAAATAQSTAPSSSFLVKEFLADELLAEATSPPSTNTATPVAAVDVMASASRLFATITSWLKYQQREALFLLLVAPDMRLFADMNKVYASHFSIVRPPGRAFVEDTSLSHLCIEVWSVPTATTAVADAAMRPASSLTLVGSRKPLHVQSMSPWAAASIGPYAQANRVEYMWTTTSEHHPKSTNQEDKMSPLPRQRWLVDHVIVSGRIGMLPKNLELARPADLFLCTMDPATQMTQDDDAVWRSFLAQFSFMMANSVVGLVHFGLAINDISHATFFVNDPSHAAWIERAWNIYFNGQQQVKQPIATTTPGGEHEDDSDLEDRRDNVVASSPLLAPPLLHFVSNEDFLKPLLMTEMPTCPMSNSSPVLMEDIDASPAAKRWWRDLSSTVFTTTSSSTAIMQQAERRPKSASVVQARVLLVTQMPKNALVEVICERRVGKLIDDDDE